MDVWEEVGERFRSNCLSPEGIVTKIAVIEVREKRDEERGVHV